ncbi:hypothetical protein PCE1_001569 [Barthelona sp. PCE]
MEDLLALEEEFFSIQQVDCTTKLSEANAVSILSRLLKMGLVTVYYTKNGREFVTPEQVRKEIVDILFYNGGRVSLVDLVVNLNIDISVIEATSDQIVADNDDFHLFQAQIITNDYLDGVYRQIDSELEDKHLIPMMEISSRFSISGTLLKESVTSAIRRGVLSAVIDGSHLYTEQYVSKCRRLIQVFANSLLEPLKVTSLLSSLKIPTALSTRLFNDVKKDGLLRGTVSNGVFVPKVFTELADSLVLGEFMSNGIISFETIESYHISTKTLDLKRRFEGAVILTDSILSQDIFGQLQEQFEGIESVCVRVSDALELPSDVTAADTEMLVKRLKRASKRKFEVVHGDILVFTAALNAFIDERGEALEKEVVAFVDDNPQFVIVTEEEPEPTKKKRGKKRNRAPVLSQEVYAASGLPAVVTCESVVQELFAFSMEKDVANDVSAFVRMSVVTPLLVRCMNVARTRVESRAQEGVAKEKETFEEQVRICVFDLYAAQRYLRSVSSKGDLGAIWPYFASILKTTGRTLLYWFTVGLDLQLAMRGNGEIPTIAAPDVIDVERLRKAVEKHQLSATDAEAFSLLVDLTTSKRVYMGHADREIVAQQQKTKRRKRKEQDVIEEQLEHVQDRQRLSVFFDSCASIFNNNCGILLRTPSASAIRDMQAEMFNEFDFTTELTTPEMFSVLVCKYHQRFGLHKTVGNKFLFSLVGFIEGERKTDALGKCLIEVNSSVRDIVANERCESEEEKAAVDEAPIRARLQGQLVRVELITLPTIESSNPKTEE